MVVQAIGDWVNQTFTPSIAALVAIQSVVSVLALLAMTFPAFEGGEVQGFPLAVAAILGWVSLLAGFAAHHHPELNSLHPAALWGLHRAPFLVNIATVVIGVVNLIMLPARGGRDTRRDAGDFTALLGDIGLPGRSSLESAVSLEPPPGQRPGTIESLPPFDF